MNKLFWKNKRVLITGHTGFKGAWLSLWLQLLQADICGIALPPNTEPNLFSLMDIEKNMQSHLSDIRDFAATQKIIHQFQPDIIIHMAAQPLVRYSYKNPIETYETNVMGTVHVLEAAKTCPSVKAIVNVTTDKCYDNKEIVRGYTEEDALGGFDPYSNSKACSELVTSAYRNSFYQSLNKGLASARAGNVIGGGDWSEDRLIADIMKNIVANHSVIIRNPTAIRPWQYVLEPLSGYLLLAEKLYLSPEKYSQAWNFGPNNEETANVEVMVRKIFSQWQMPNAGWKIQREDNAPHEAHFLMLNTHKSKTQLQWQPQLSLYETIKWVCDWYQAWINHQDMRAVTLHQIQAYETLTINETVT